MDINGYIVVASAAVAALAMVTGAGLAGWRGWLQLKRQELDRGQAALPAPAGTRIEMADLKERIRKLEAIAAGVDL